MPPRRFLIAIMAAAGLLIAAGDASSFAQGLVALGGGAEPTLFNVADHSPPAAVPETIDSGSPDLQPFGRTADSAPPQTQDQTAAGVQSSSSGSSSDLSVNPVTGIVSATSATYQPLASEQRWKLYWKMNYLSKGAYFGPFFNALLLDQATGSPAQWGGGFAGYGRRVASRTASAILQGTFQAPAAYLLHEDVRYIASKRRGFRHRALHAIAYSFLTYKNSGRPTLNIANLGAYYASTAVTTAWLPEHYKVLEYTLSNSTAQIGLTIPVNLLQEFWPEIVRKFHHRRDQ
ncbi:MAG TPA: hypothetical protein VGZ29_11000 [Terriglobia bacterium]|nr:hypothetical protein [Terriglobia bacterium]